MQHLYEARVLNEATLNDWRPDETQDDDTELFIGDLRHHTNTDFWRDLSEIEPRNLDMILYADGCHPDWRGLADMRMDLTAAIDHVFANVKKEKHERTGWALMSLVYGITIEQAAFMAGITRPAMNAHVIRCRKLMREKLTPYLEPAQNGKRQASEVKTERPPKALVEKNENGRVQGVQPKVEPTRSLVTAKHHLGRFAGYTTMLLDGMVLHMPL